jgi:hypothetical protein
VEQEFQDEFTVARRKVHEFKFNPPHESYSLAEVFQRADFVRQKLEQYHPGEYALMVTVRGQARGRLAQRKVQTDF